MTKFRVGDKVKHINDSKSDHKTTGIIEFVKDEDKSCIEYIARWTYDDTGLFCTRCEYTESVLKLVPTLIEEKDIQKGDLIKRVQTSVEYFRKGIAGSNGEKTTKFYLLDRSVSKAEFKPKPKEGDFITLQEVHDLPAGSWVRIHKRNETLFEKTPFLFLSYIFDESTVFTLAAYPDKKEN